MLDWHLMQDCFSSKEMRGIWSETATLSVWIKVEQALARAQCDVGLIPKVAADAIDSFSPAHLDRDQMQQDMKTVGRPIVGLVKQMRAHVGPELAPHVHFRSTTQDIMDTGLSMQMKLGLRVVLASVDRLIAALGEKIEDHKSTRMIGRTNGQHAVPMLLSTKLSVWQAELGRHVERLNDASRRGLLVQVGGPLGDLAYYDGDTGQRVKSRLAGALDLGTVEPHWQNARDGVAEIVTGLGALCASLSKIAHNINLLSSSDIGEISEIHSAGKGASSSMHHKKNQRASEFAEASSRLGRQRAEHIGELTMHQHERSGGAWVAEWVVVPEVFLLTSGALNWSERMLANMMVCEEAMAEKL
jgi:3-carboxy-cis,cis-muconate cycloisomerase